jgi:hypothetical protein
MCKGPDVAHRALHFVQAVFMGTRHLVMQESEKMQCHNGDDGYTSDPEDDVSNHKTLLLFCGDRASGECEACRYRVVSMIPASYARPP